VVRLRRLWPFAVLVAGACVVLVAVFALRQPPSSTPQATLPSPVPIISTAPTSSPTAALVQPPNGMRIRIPELGIDLPVVAGDGINAPLNKAVLYPYLQLPGSGNRSMVYAHARNGMFGPLFHAQVGQRIEISQPNAPPLAYRISEYYPRWSTTDLRWLQTLPQEQLVLVTCTTYNYNDPRIVVVAVPL
jgi:LPXTG-site transpeptidase (sortase) family protein